MFVSKRHVECALKISPFYKDVGGNAYTNFFLARPLNIKTRQCYIDIILLGIIEIFRSSRANIHINKCYFAKSYSAKCCKEKIWNILGDRFMCEIILSHKYSFTDDLRSITYYIICTLTRIENVLIYVAHANMHCDWTIYYFIKTIFGIWVKVWSGKFGALIHYYYPNLRNLR